MSSPVRFDLWQNRKPVIVTERNRKKITLPAFSANCGSSLFGKSVYFNGAFDSLSIASSVLGNTSFTIEAWINTKGQQNDTSYPIFWDLYRTDAPFDPRYLIYIYNRFINFFYRKSGAVSVITSTTEIQSNSWVHIAVSWDGVTIKIYIDGVLNNSQAVASPVDAPIAGGMAIGFTRYLANRVFIGNISELRIWFSARTADQIVDFRFSPRDTTQILDTNLSAYFKMGNIVTVGSLREYITATNLNLVSPGSIANDLTTGPPLKYGASFVAAQWPITISNKSSIKFPIVPPIGTTFALIVRWTDTNNILQRRSLWTVSGVDVVPIPASYVGEVLPTSFTLEAWNMDGRETISLPSDLIIYTSLTTLPVTDVDHESQVAVEPIIDTTLAANFPLTPFPLVLDTQQVYPS